jgi:phytoene dehydrogenase-like protein
MTERIVVVGGGVAGLVCARVLQAAGRDVLLFERDAEIGGRVRTRRVDGFSIDRGFQVAFEAYPTLGRHVDWRALDMRWFAPAGRICTADGRTTLVGDALADPTLLWPTLTQGGLSWGDLWRVLRLRRDAVRRRFEECFAPATLGRSTRDYLAGLGVTPRGIARFFAPFYGGILLDRSLETSASVLLYTFKMLAEGRTGVPRAGMGALSAQMAAGLRPGTLRTGIPVAGVTVRDGAVRGVTLADGTTIEATAVVLATEAPALAKLAESAGSAVTVPTETRGVTTCYFASRTPVLPGRALWLNAAEPATVSHAVTVTEVAPEYAPTGWHLLATNTVGSAAALPDEGLLAGVRADVSRMSGRPLPEDLRVVAIERVPLAQVAQPPRATQAQVPVRTEVPGLVFASELWHSSSLEGAARAGEAAAAALIGTDRPA